MKNEGEHLIVFDGVYPPSEDSYLLLDSLELNEKDIVLEVGSGSGVITIDLLKRVSRVVSIDIAMSAVRNTMENIRRHGLGHVGAVIQTDLISAISPDAGRRGGHAPGPEKRDRKQDRKRERGPPVTGMAPPRLRFSGPVSPWRGPRLPVDRTQAAPPPIAWSVSIIFWADSSMSITRESIRDTK